jgi:hypothetical protein
VNDRFRLGAVVQFSPAYDRSGRYRSLVIS